MGQSLPIHLDGRPPGGGQSGLVCGAGQRARGQPLTQIIGRRMPQMLRPRVA